jgi:peptide maturation system acyl carrier-related protein
MQKYINNDIEMRLKNIFRNRFEIDLSSKEISLLNENLLGKSINLSSTDLLYLLHDIEDEFGISIPEKQIADGNFSSFNNIVKIIYSQLV